MKIFVREQQSTTEADIMNGSAVGSINGTHTTASGYMSDGLTMLKVLRETRERTIATLRAEREVAAARVAEIDEMLVEADGDGLATKPKAARRERAYQPHSGSMSALIAKIAANPGIGTAEVHAAYGPNKASATTALYNAMRSGKVRREGEKGSYRFYPATEQQTAAA